MLNCFNIILTLSLLLIVLSSSSKAASCASHSIERNIATPCFSSWRSASLLHIQTYLCQLPYALAEEMGTLFDLNLPSFNSEVVSTSLKSYSMGNVCWLTGTDLCCACAAFRKGTIQTVLNITFNWKSSQLNLCWNQYNILRINIDIYLSFTETLIWPVTRKVLL